MTPDEILKQKEAIEAEYGPWTTVSFPLGHGIETAPERREAHFRLRRIVQTIEDLAGKSWDRLRILDLGSLEGTFAMEFASHGAQVVAIEGREANNAKARFAAGVLGLSRIEFLTDDVRNLSRQKYGQFDVVLCSGILYHLAGEDGCKLLQSIAEVCTRLAIIDTQVGLKDAVSISWGGKTYSGILYTEHSASDAQSVKLARSWASLDNETSLWFTKPSLLNPLRDVGFTSVLEVLRPQSFPDFADRLTFAAIKGEPLPIVLSPQLENTPEPDWPEHSLLQPHPAQIAKMPLWRRLGGAIRRRIGI